ncbi:MAG: hypothetical protein Pg6A_15940 [Termitinemataceae bacterium]|nr:MAG: hypothetical protein Pg6A_15940 [Termitinemataceae bacterium]
MNNLKFCFVLFFAQAFFSPLFAQEPQVETISSVTELSSLIGISIHELITRFGPPSTVYPVRGEAVWQDDVVFAYKDVDFYLVKDRVWQLRVQSANGIRTGDAKTAITMTHGANITDKGNRIIVAVRGFAMPLEYHYYLDSHGRVQSIYLCRSDY